MDLSIAVFHVPVGSPSRVRRHWALFQLLATSVARVMPKARLHLITIEGAKVPGGLAVHDTLRIPWTRPLPQTLMLAQIRGWRDYLNGPLAGEVTVFLDADMIVQRDLSAILPDPAEVALTYTLAGDAPHPINAGVIAARAGEGARRFFGLLHDTAEALDPKLHAWYGDQEALTRLVGREHFDTLTAGNLTADGLTADNLTTDGLKADGLTANGPVKVVEAGSVSLALLPCEVWNYSEPYAEGSSGRHNQPVLNRTDAPVILHFKGKRKAIMPDYADRFLNYRILFAPFAPGRRRIIDLETGPASEPLSVLQTWQRALARWPIL